MSPRSTAWGAYAQIAETIRQRIVSGDYPPGSRLPSESTLCQEFGVARNTIRRALADLETQGLIHTSPGLGRLVRDPEATDEAPTEQPAGPRYRQIANDLKTKIEAGELAQGAPVPSEASIGTQYAVSRGTARQALAELEGAGLVEAHHGKGRYVTRRPQTPPPSP